MNGANIDGTDFTKAKIKGDYDLSEVFFELWSIQNNKIVKKMNIINIFER